MIQDVDTESERGYGGSNPGPVRNSREAAAAGEDEEADIDFAEDREFAGFLHETAASFGEGNLTSVLVYD
ncbi:hypothetical protein RHGRI_034192 [Rhododendron griersonianum]|uniref:Uncharacterized protein n=1 Tax=Rhododendron griersonianum TaxID=479676 RepID=A0AAV6HZJ6_9ERIC|nr:hypothetical protein RHGRI_034192 [Rhododendron griersonianum]